MFWSHFFLSHGSDLFSELFAKSVNCTKFQARRNYMSKFMNYVVVKSRLFVTVERNDFFALQLIALNAESGWPLVDLLARLISSPVDLLARRSARPSICSLVRSAHSSICSPVDLLASRSARPSICSLVHSVRSSICSLVDLLVRSITISFCWRV